MTFLIFIHFWVRHFANQTQHLRHKNVGFEGVLKEKKKTKKTKKKKTKDILGISRRHDLFWLSDPFSYL